jgi:tetratricopeptide (TPR) repeat protein
VALDKSRTSVGMKVMLVVIAVAMIGYLSAGLIGAFSLFSGPKQTTGTSTDTTAQIAQKYTARVAANDAALASEPASYAVLVNQGNTYFDWGVEVSKAASTNTALQGSEQPMWLSAAQYYEKATKVKNDDPKVAVDLSIAYFYSGETTKAIVTAEVVRVKNPDFAPAWFNLGVFYSATGNTPAAVAALEKAVALDPKGKNINLDYAKQQLQTLKAAGGTSTPATTAP